MREKPCNRCDNRGIVHVELGAWDDIAEDNGQATGQCPQCAGFGWFCEHGKAGGKQCDVCNPMLPGVA